MSSSNHAVQADRPERSRNARAQARHRAKRKAYIEQLEQTLTKLQLASGFSQDQINVLPPPLLKIRELEQENGRLQKENDDLRRLLTDSPHSTRFSSDPVRRQPLPAYPDFRGIDRDYNKRRKEGLYISPSDTPPHGNELSSRAPPPLSVPQPVSHHYTALHSNSANHNHNQPFELPDTGFQMPNTPSESSATSSPPFSPLQIQHPLQSSLDHRPHLSNHHSIPNYTHSTGHYSSVKVEDDHYLASQPAHQNTHTLHYPYTNGHSHTHNGLDWHGGYSSERGHLQR